MIKVFISYSSVDAAYIQLLIVELKKHQVFVWLDHEQLQPGTPDWEKTLRNAITSSDGIIYVASPDSATSAYVRDELSIARDNNIPVFPLWARGNKWSECVPLGWGIAQFMDGRAGVTPQLVSSLTVAITKIDNKIGEYNTSNAQGFNNPILTPEIPRFGSSPVNYTFQSRHFQNSIESKILTMLIPFILSIIGVVICHQIGYDLGPPIAPDNPSYVYQIYTINDIYGLVAAIIGFVLCWILGLIIRKQYLKYLRKKV